jgi:hypothetical protein
VRLVLGTRPVAQHLQALAVLDGQCSSARCALDARAQRVLAAAKNMPSLVRASLTSLAPVSSLTVSERARRWRASSTISSHSSCDSRPPNTTTRGLRMRQHLHLAVAGHHDDLAVHRQRLGHQHRRRQAVGLGMFGQETRKVSSSAAAATSSFQPLSSIDFRTISGD